MWLRDTSNHDQRYQFVAPGLSFVVCLMGYKYNTEKSIKSIEYISIFCYVQNNLKMTYGDHRQYPMPSLSIGWFQNETTIKHHTASSPTALDPFVGLTRVPL